jgi:hypothetical protein
LVDPRFGRQAAIYTTFMWSRFLDSLFSRFDKSFHDMGWHPLDFLDCHFNQMARPIGRIEGQMNRSAGSGPVDGLVGGDRTLNVGKGHRFQTNLYSPGSAAGSDAISHWPEETENTEGRTGVGRTTRFALVC